MMKLGELKTLLSKNPDVPLHFVLPDRSFVPTHFHVTEIGRVRKDFIDCGGTVRISENCVLQVWVADDIDHRLDTSKLVKILEKGADLFEASALPVEIEYDNGLISQYPVLRVEVNQTGIVFQLGTKHAACLAPELCSIDPTPVSSCCAPGCC